MDSLSELELFILFVGITLLVILIIARARIARKGNNIEEEEESFPIYQTKDILLQEKPHDNESWDYIPTKSIGEEKNLTRSLLYLILVLFLVWIIISTPIVL